MKNVRLWIDYVDDATDNPGGIYSIPPPAPDCTAAGIDNMRAYWQGFKGRRERDAKEASEEARRAGADVLIVVKHPPPKW
jgi:hypothetical protein